MAKNQTFWTKEEIALLMEYYPKYGTSGEWVKGLQPEHQKRTAILGAAGHYGVRFYKAPVAWTTREMMLIREHYPNEGATGEWVKELKPEHQTAKAISARAAYLGIRRKSKPRKVAKNDQ